MAEMGRVAVMVCLALSTARAADVPAFPSRLSQAGLYSDFASRMIDPKNIPYSPQYALWSDGAAKRRWIYLPDGQTIDISDPDVWSFPAGTRVWKEFSFEGRLVETRLMEELGDGDWKFASYIWNMDQSEAVLAPAEGLREAAEIRTGVKYDIPGVRDCQACHVNLRTEVLGFSALQLSPDRDPATPSVEQTIPGLIDLKTLIERKLLRPYPAGWLKDPPRIGSSSPTERAALGYLHANCGNCHNPSGSLDALNLLLRHSVVPGLSGEPAITTAVYRKGRFRIPDEGQGETYLLRPGDPAHSAVLFRMSSRIPFYQMPPLATKLVDAAAVDLVRRWILEILRKEGEPPQGGAPSDGS